MKYKNFYPPSFVSEKFNIVNRYLKLMSDDMKCYAIKAKIPRNQKGYFKNFKREIIKKCLREKITCVVEFIDGRIIIFSDSDIRELAMNINGVLDIFSVVIYKDLEKLIKDITIILENCDDFAIKSNKKEVEKNIGGIIAEKPGKKVNLNNPDCTVEVEKREKYYLLFE